MKEFARKARAILEWVDAGAEDEPLEWPLHRRDGEYNELWVSEVFRRLEEAFYPFFLRPVRQRAAETPWACQDRRDAVRMERQRRIAAAIWRACGPETARRYARILRAVPKPPSLPDVEARSAFLQEIERLDPPPPSPEAARLAGIADSIAALCKKLPARRSKEQLAAAKKGGGRNTSLDGDEIERVRTEAQRLRTKCESYTDYYLARLIHKRMFNGELGTWSTIPVRKTIENYIGGRTGRARRAEDRKSERNR